METSATKLMNRMELLYENIYNLLDGFQKAVDTKVNQSIEVTLKKADGTTELRTINSFQKIQQELNRIDNNYKSLISAENLSYTIGADGSLSQQTKTSFINAEYLENFIFSGDSCIVDKTSAIDDLIFPLVKIPVTIDSTLLSDIKCKIFEISKGWDKIPENPKIIDLKYLEQQDLVNFKEIDRVLPLNKQQIKYFGKFTIETLVPISSDTFTLTLNSVKYSGLNNIGNSNDLKVNDILVSKRGLSKYEITYIDKITKKIEVTRIAGTEVIAIGIDALYFNEIIETTENVVNIPIKPTQQLIVFLSTQNLKNISYPSVGIKFDTSNYKVNYNDTTYTIDEFFTLFVTNFSEYLLSFVNETSIPIKLGVQPAKPVLVISNFKVIQLNKHLTNSKSITEINNLNKSKQKIQNDIDYKDKSIANIQKELDTKKFSSSEEKQKRLDKIIVLRNEINALKQNQLTISRDIDTNAIENGLKTVKPKYSAIGFWPIQEPIYSPATKPQNIIKYDVQYRYLSKDVDTIDNTSYTMISNGKEVTVAFSQWIDMPSKTLNKIFDTNGNIDWEVPIMDSIDDININQLKIPITEGESLEIRLRSVSEAGYPIAPLKSDWSDIIKIDFPAELKDSNISSTITQNNTDLSKAEFESILRSVGLLSHIAGTIRESEKTFLHQASDITSGQFTTEQKNIPLDTIINNILADILLIKDSSISKNITINLIDFNSESFVVTNNTTLEMSAGNYSDSVNILDTGAWGSIIRKKCYIKIANKNNIPIEVKSLVPGTTFNSSSAAGYYNVPIYNTDKFIQDAKQIFYFRNIDLTGQNEEAFKLVKPKMTPITTQPLAQDIDSTVADTSKNIVYFDAINDMVKICKLLPTYSTGFNAFTIEHPLYNYQNLNAIKNEFNRVKLYTATLKAKQYQSETIDTDVLGLGFVDSDFYAIGNNTCGAFLYPVISNKSSFQVVGNTTVATLIIPKESELLIPIIFEYRMIDRLGNINGEKDFDSNVSLEYSKKIGIDILINNEVFKFDINVSSKLKSKVASIDTKNISSVISAYNNEPPGTPG